MTFSLFESPIYRELFFDAEVAELFEDSAVIQSMIKVESALAKVQGELGLIPKESSDVIVEILAGYQIEPGSLAESTGHDGTPVPALVANLRKSLPDPHQSYLHWGATSQDIMDTALVLRLAAVCQIIESRIKTLLIKLAEFASQYAHQPVVARTRSQIATPTSLGAIMVSWGSPLLSQLQMLEFIKPRLLKISLAGAAGNSAAFGQQSGRLREELARALHLNCDVVSWHTDRTALAEFSSLTARICASLGKIAEDCILASQSEVAELTFKQGGTSSTMPQKNNPIQAETIVSLYRISQSLDILMNNAVLHRQQRDGSAWMQEWFALPQLVMSAVRAIQLTNNLLGDMQVNQKAMCDRLDTGSQLAYAEAVSFELSREMSRAIAQAEVKKFCSEAIASGVSLISLLEQKYPRIAWESVFTAESQIGDSLAQVADFVTKVNALS